VSEAIRTVAVVGAGVIGASWAAHFLAHGRKVVASDPAEGAEGRLRVAVDTHWRRLREQGRRETS
jgi:3-hydroxyacyl-CoA dehydrogenase